MQIYRIWALRRSGQHGIIHWLDEYFKLTGKTLILNNVSSQQKSEILRRKQTSIFREKMKINPDYLVYNIEEKHYNLNIKSIVNVPY